MSSSPKILTVYYKHKPGGFCVRLQMQIEAYLENGWEVHYVAVEPFPYTHENLIPHILPTPMKNHDTIPFWLYFFLTAPVYTLFAGLRVQPNLISVFSPLYACICLPLKRIVKAPMITFLRTVPNNPSFAFRSSSLVTRIEAVLEKFGLKYSDRVLANSKSVRSGIVKNHGKEAGEKIEILYNNIKEINFDREAQRKKVLGEFSLNENAFLISTSGLLIKRKNLKSLITAFSGVNSPKAILLIIGDGDEADDLKHWAKTLGVADHTLFSGWREDALELLQGTDLFVFTSSQEGMSNSLLEAIACEIPCMVSNIPENIEVIQNPKQHFASDQPQVLAEKINQLIEHPDDYNEILEATLRDGNRFIFDWKEQVVQKADEVMNPQPQTY